MYLFYLFRWMMNKQSLWKRPLKILAPSYLLRCSFYEPSFYSQLDDAMYMYCTYIPYTKTRQSWWKKCFRDESQCRIKYTLQYFHLLSINLEGFFSPASLECCALSLDCSGQESWFDSPTTEPWCPARLAMTASFQKPSTSTSSSNCALTKRRYSWTFENQQNFRTLERFLGLSMYGEASFTLFANILQFRINGTYPFQMLYIILEKLHCRLFLQVPINDVEAGALGLPPDAFARRFSGAHPPDPDDPVVVFCKRGGRAFRAKEALAARHGFSNVAVYVGSFDDWSERKAGNK